MLADFARHEQGHRAIFAEEMSRRGRPRCTSYWLCGLGGWCLGLITGLLGRKAIAVTTVAVERTMLTHLHDYRTLLADSDPAGHAAVSAILADEEVHHDTFAPTAGGWLARWLDPIVAGSTEAVIRTGMRA